MNTLYPQLWKGLRLVEGLEKIAFHDAGLATVAQANSAAVADELFERVKRAALTLPGPAPVGVKVASLMVEMRSAHTAVGEKLASNVEVHADMLNKLAVAFFVDSVLDTQAEKLAGEELEHARAVQCLGREYAVHLMNGLLS